MTSASGWMRRWTLGRGVAVVAVACAVVGIVALGTSGSDVPPEASAAGTASTTTAAGAVDRSSTPESSAPSNVPNGSAAAPGDAPTVGTSPEQDPQEGPDASPPKSGVGPDGIRVLQGDDVPVDVKVSSTSGLGDGDEVRLRAVARADEQIYALEARLCASGASTRVDADLWPTVGGQCTPKPLSSRSDHLVEALAAPPSESVEMVFRVGHGSARWDLSAGGSASLTCGPDDPCDLVVKFQITGGFGFRSYPLSFAP